jgi:hypothetical protein
MNWMGLFLFLATAVTFFVFGMLIMGVVATKGRYEATTEAYKIGYEKGVNAEKERIGKLIDTMIDNEKEDGRNEKTD